MAVMGARRCSVDVAAVCGDFADARTADDAIVPRRGRHDDAGSAAPKSPPRETFRQRAAAPAVPGDHAHTLARRFTSPDARTTSPYREPLFSEIFFLARNKKKFRFQTERHGSVKKKKKPRCFRIFYRGEERVNFTMTIFVVFFFVLRARRTGKTRVSNYRSDRYLCFTGLTALKSERFCKISYIFLSRDRKTEKWTFPKALRVTRNFPTELKQSKDIGVLSIY